MKSCKYENFIACKNGKWGVVSEGGIVVVPFEYDQIKAVHKKTCSFEYDEKDDLMMRWNWDIVLMSLKNEIIDCTYNMFIKTLVPILVENKVVLLKAKSEFHKDRINENLISKINRVVRRVFGKEYCVKILS